MDPLGIVKGIASFIFFGYIGLALVALLVAIAVPKTTQTKILWALAVIVGFSFPPIRIYHQSKQQSNQQTITISSACADASFQIQPINVGRGYAVHREFLRMGLSRTLSADDIIRHLLEKKLSYLEINHDYQDWWQFGNLYSNKFGYPYVRLSLQRQGHPFCAGFEKWIAEYPAQRLPWIRMLGLTESYCIGAEGVTAPQSRFRVELTETRGILAHEQGNGMWKYHFELQDSKGDSPAGWISSYVNRDYGNRKIMCGKKLELDQFKAAIGFEPDRNYLTISEVTNDDPPNFPKLAPALEQDLKALRESETIRKLHTTNIITPTGNAWIAARYVKTDSRGSFSLQGYYLVSLINDKAHKIFIQLDGKPVHDITGMVVEQGKIKIVALERESREPTILEYSRTGRPLRALTPTAEQWFSLQPKK